MNFFTIFATLCFVASLQHTEGHKPDLCKFMNQYCSADQETNSQQIQVVEGRRGKAGPKGLQGPPGVVDYERITRELEVKMEQKINRSLQIYNEQVEKEKEQSKRIEDLEKKITGLEEWKKRFYQSGCNKVTESSWNGTGGIFNIYPESFPDGIQVYCDLTSDGGGWTVFQRRMDGSVDFYRGWDDYVNGFGENDKEFWLGLETIYQLTKNGNYELRVDIGDWEGNTAYAQYGTFSIAGSDDNYRLTVGDYSGNARDSLSGRHNGRQFSTKDRDNDGLSDGNCAVLYTGAWWYESCHYSNLNGVYHVGTGADAKNIAWYYWRNTHDYSYKFTEMKFRKKQN